MAPLAFPAAVPPPGFTGAGGLIWAGAFVGLGWLFSEQLELVASYAMRLGGWLVALLAAAFAAYIAWKYIARQRFLRRRRHQRTRRLAGQHQDRRAPLITLQHFQSKKARLGRAFAI